MKVSFLFRSTISLLIIIFFSSFFLNSFSKNLKDKFDSIAVLKCKNFASEVIINTIQEQLKKDDYQNSIFLTSENHYKEFNVVYLNSLLKDFAKGVYENLSHLENHTKSLETSSFYELGMVEEIPFSLVFDNPLLGSLGPSIPICFRLIGNVTSNLESKVSSFGMNNALIELYVHITLDSLVYVPLICQSETINVDLPIYSSLIEGNIPSIALGNHSIEGVNKQIYEGEAL